MFAQPFASTSTRLAMAGRLLLAVALALAVPQMIVAAAPPAPGTQGFLVWF